MAHRPPRRLRVALAFVLPLVLAACGPAMPESDAPAAAAPSAERPDAPPPPGRAALVETIRALEAMPAGIVTVADLDLPPDFLERVADRMLRERHQALAHAVNSDDPDAVTAWDPGPRPAAPEGRAIVVHPAPAPAEVREARRRLAEGWPASVGHRRDVPPTLAAIEGFGDTWPPSISLARDEDAPIATAIARRLPREGLAAVTVEAIAALEQARGGAANDADLAVRLRDLGLPVDLLEAFVVPAARAGVDAGAGPELPAELPAVLRWIAWTRGELAAGTAVEALVDRAAAATFAWRPTVPGLELMLEDGTEPLGGLRLQATRGEPFAPAGGGDSLDLIRAIATLVDDLPLAITVEDRFAPDLLPRLASWRDPAAAPLAVHVEPLVVSQWAQDNAKSGLAPAANGGREPVLLLPRYASRGEIGASLVPGDTYLAETLALGGLRTATSPLHFQGGNLLPVRDPRTGGRLLLVADAEIHRNRALGLSAEEVERALAAETGCDAVLVLAPPAFHLDFATSIRALDGRSVAFVHDERAAIDLVLGLAADALAAAGRLDPAAPAAIRADLAAGRDRAVLDRLGPVLYGARRPDGMTDLALVRAFDEGPGDPGIGTFQRVLTAFELLMGRTLRPEQVPDGALARSYVASARRRIETQKAFTAALRAAGFEPVPLAGWSDQGRSLNTVNLVQDRRRILVPITGGRLGAVDEAARRALEVACGPRVRLVEIPTAETQRRSGAVHCAVGPIPAASRPVGPTPPPRPAG